MLKLLIAFRDHTVVNINLIQQLILLGDGFKHDPTSNHKVHVVSHGVEQESNLSLKLMMTVRCLPPPPAKTNLQCWNPMSRLIKTQYSHRYDLDKLSLSCPPQGPAPNGRIKN